MRPYSLTDLAALAGVDASDVRGVEATGVGTVTIREGEFLTSAVVRRLTTVPQGPSGLGPDTVVEAEGDLQFGLRTRTGAIAWTPPLPEPVLEPQPPAPSPKRKRRKPA